MGDAEAPSKRKRKYMNAFSKVSPEEVELIFGFELYQFYDSQIPIEQFITTITPEQLKKKNI